MVRADDVRPRGDPDLPVSRRASKAVTASPAAAGTAADLEGPYRAVAYGSAATAAAGVRRPAPAASRPEERAAAQRVGRQPLSTPVAPGDGRPPFPFVRRRLRPPAAPLLESPAVPVALAQAAARRAASARSAAAVSVSSAAALQCVAAASAARHVQGRRPVWPVPVFPRRPVAATPALRRPAVVRRPVPAARRLAAAVRPSVRPVAEESPQRRPAAVPAAQQAPEAEPVPQLQPEPARVQGPVAAASRQAAA